MRRRLVALAAAALVISCGYRGAAEGPARFISTWTFEPDEEWIGGFSGIDSPDGTRFAMVSDSGYFALGRFRREGGVITGLERFRARGQTLPEGGTQKDRDAEGLAWAGADLFVSFEGAHEVRRFARPTAPPQSLPRHPDFATFEVNASLEALAVTGSGALLTMPEHPREGRYPLYRFDGGSWSRLGGIPAPGGFRAVGADVGPDGWLYLLERRFVLPFAFASRVRRLLLRDGEIVADETLLVTPPGRHDNLEGLAVWRDGGEVRLLMVSDDNYLMVQTIEVVEYAVPPALDPARSQR